VLSIPNGSHDRNHHKATFDLLYHFDDIFRKTSDHPALDFQCVVQLLLVNASLSAINKDISLKSVTIGID
jgi:hypothetical protein